MKAHSTPVLIVWQTTVPTPPLSVFSLFIRENKKTGSQNPGYFRSPQKIGHPAWDGSDETCLSILSAGTSNRKNKACQGKIKCETHEKMKDTEAGSGISNPQ
jgi:hypothetical protein